MCFDVSWIAPEAKGLPALGWLGELGQLAQIEGVRVHACTGQFSRQQLAAELRRRARVKLWTGHGQAGGLIAPDGTLIRPKWLATQAKVGLPQVVVLAACGSQERDDELHSMAEEISRAGVNVIGFPAQTEDAAAVAFNVELIRALASGARLGDAFDVALEEIQHTRTARGVFLAGGLMNGYSDVVNRLETLEAGQRELKDGLGLIMEHLGIGAATCK